MSLQILKTVSLINGMISDLESELRELTKRLNNSLEESGEYISSAAIKRENVIAKIGKLNQSLGLLEEVSEIN